MQACEHLSKCLFFNKYNKTLNETCKILIKNYCMGRKKNLCKRLLMFMQNNEMPSADIAPNGINLSES